MPSISEIRQQYPQYDDMSDADLAGALHTKFYSDMPRADFDQKIGLAAQAAKEQPVDPVIDTIKGAGIGAVKSTIGMADVLPFGLTAITGGAGDIVRRPDTATNFADKFDQIKGGPENRNPTLLSSSADIQSRIEEKTGKFYEPKTYAGQWGETVGSFLPAAVGGPGSLAGRLVTQATIPALATEGAGYLTKGTAAETPSRMAAALVAGPAAARTLAGRAAPAAAELRQAYREVRNDPAVTGVPVNAPAIANDVRTGLNARNFDDLNAPVPYERANRLENMAPATAGDVMAVRQRLSADQRAAAGNQITGAPEAATQAAKRTIDDSLEAIDPRWRDANRNYAIAHASEYLNGRVVEQALDRAGAGNSGNNIGNSMRSRLASILSSPRASSNFTEPQLDQIRQIDRGTTATNTMRAWANRLGGGGGLGQTLLMAGAGGSAGYYGGGETGAATGLGLALAGKGLKMGENALVRRQINQLDRNIRGGSPLARNQPAITQADLALLRQALLRRESAATHND